MFVAESASVPTNRETKMPSTMVYIDMKIIMITVGSANRSRDPKWNSLEIAGCMRNTSCCKKNHCGL